MSNQDDLVFFKEDDNSSILDSSPAPWRILIVDDEIDVHTLTKMVLAGYKFENRPLEIISAYSGKEAIDILMDEKDIAIILLDVVMETEDAGLKCVKQIREELNNHESRIILRTGQPGQAPEQQVIVDYDINDYKAKTELTSSKLFTTVTTSLRSYKYIKTIQQNKIGLENIIAASSFLFELQSFTLFAKGILKQLTSILSLDKDSLYVNSSSLSAFKDTNNTDYNILAGTGSFAGHEREGINNVVSKQVYKSLIDAAESQKSIFTDKTYTGYFKTKKGEHTLLYLQWQRPLTVIDRDLISIFAINIAAAFENISRNNDIAESQKRMINILSDKIEGICKHSVNHVSRTTSIATILGKKKGLDDKQITELQITTPMHDIGKVDDCKSTLTKEGKLTSEEFNSIKKHTTCGYKILDTMDDHFRTTAKIIAHQHHEKWDGSGYPQGLKGEEINIYGRIVALADVFESLLSDKCYRKAWNLEQTLDYIKNEKGKHFDPSLVDILLDSIDEIKEVMSL